MDGMGNESFFDVFSSTEQAWNNGMGQPWQPDEGFCKGEMLRVSLKKHEKIKHVPIVSMYGIFTYIYIEIDQMKVNMPYMDPMGFGYTSELNCLFWGLTWYELQI